MVVLMYLVCFIGMLISIVVCALRVIFCGIGQSLNDDGNTVYRNNKHNKILKNMGVSVVLFLLCVFLATVGA